MGTFESGDFFKRLRIPVLNFLDRGHLVQAIGEGAELFYSVRQTNWELFRKKL